LLSMPLLLNHGKNMRTALSRHQDILRNAGNPEWEPRLAEVTAWRAKPGQEDPQRLRDTLTRMKESGILHPDCYPLPDRLQSKEI